MPLVGGWLAFWIVVWFERQSVWFARALDANWHHPWMVWIDALPVAIVTGTFAGLVFAAVPPVTRGLGERWRGVRRIVLVLSCTIGAISFVAVALEVAAIADYQAQRLAYDQREQSFQAWLAQQPISDARVAAARARLSPAAKFDEQLRQYLAGDEVTNELRREHARRTGLENVVSPVYPHRMWWNWRLRWIVLLGCGAVTGLTALPWGVVYLLRWIVQGFVAESGPREAVTGERRP